MPSNADRIFAQEVFAQAHPELRQRVNAIYHGSDGEATKALYAELEPLGPAGALAVNLFRAQKASARAKVYRGGDRGRGSYKSMAYDEKNWSIDNLGRVLADHAAALNVRWGWKVDPEQEFHRWLLYVELPTGQVSFHASSRGAGPDYPGDFDGAVGHSPGRICAYVAALLARRAAA